MSNHVTSHVALNIPVKRNASCRPPVHGDERHGERRDDRTDVGAGVEDARRERALASREPFGDRLDRGRKVAGLAEPERKARDAEAERGGRERVAHRCEAPHSNHECVADACANAVDDGARAE
jgi:hypothetical protein